MLWESSKVEIWVKEFKTNKVQQNCRVIFHIVKYIKVSKSSIALPLKNILISNVFTSLISQRMRKEPETC